MRNRTVLIMFFAIQSLVLTNVNAEVKNNYKNAIEGNEQLSHKYRMTSYLLTHSPLTTRILGSEDKVAKMLLNRAQNNYQIVQDKIDNEDWLEANAIIDSVLRDLSAGAQLLNRENVKYSRYHEELRKVKSFVLPDWKNLTADQENILSNSLESIDKHINKASEEAVSGRYDVAIKNLQSAYDIKKTLVNTLKHEETIVYDLMFDTERDEYVYMVNRNKHYIELVQIVLDKKTINNETRSLIDTYLYQGNKSLLKADRLEAQGRHVVAVEVLSESINQLSDALKILGIKI